MNKCDGCGQEKQTPFEIKDNGETLAWLCLDCWMAGNGIKFVECKTANDALKLIEDL